MDEKTLKALANWAKMGMGAFHRIMALVTLIQSGEYDRMTPDEREALLTAPSHEQTVAQAEDELKEGQ